jgi:uncharacterized protein YfaS (alpha-2-macroglobulin family)
MKRRLLGGIIAFASVAAAFGAGPRDAQWEKVDGALAAGLPKTAIAELQPIIAAALADHAYGEAIKAVGRRIALESIIQGDKPEARILRMQAEVAKAPAAMKPAMEAILAHWYWEYFQQNRWRFMQRTRTGAAPGPDFQTWDLAQILAEIDRHFSAALADSAGLKATPIGAYDDLLNPGSAPDNYRPTLFDFLTYDALAFYQAGEQGGAAAEDEFEIAADSPIFGDAAEFLQWRPAGADAASPQRKAIVLYQELLRFHRSDSDRSAFHDADLARLDFGWNLAVGDTKDDRFEAALRRFIAATSAHEVSARALAALATQLDAKGEPAQARQLAEQGLAAFPDTAGGAECYNLIQTIEAKSLRLDTEHVWNPPWPTLNVTYRNLTKIYFRAVAVDFSDYLARGQWGFGDLNADRLHDLLAVPPALSWAADLPPTSDFKEQTKQLSAPTSLKPGFYIVLASPDSAFDDLGREVSVATVWVSDLALVLQTRTDRGDQGGFVLRANSGEPVAGAVVRLWRRDHVGWLAAIAPTTTDANGQFRFPTDNQIMVVLAEHEGQAVSSAHEIYSFGRASERRFGARTVFFTDRAIYRPGQTISYKGVSVHFDQPAGKYSAAAGLAVTVVFRDANNQEIARATQVTNDYGSFSGVFTAPRDRLLGSMSLEREGQPDSRTDVRVEEYKRPKFQVEINPPAAAATLGTVVEITGKAAGYTGAPVGSARVAWRVERAVICPYWCWWWQPQSAKAIAHGSAVTGPDGAFRVQFRADPDRAVPVKNEPTFSYTLHADVTDLTGETRSEERTLRAGYTALQATLSADDWQTPETPLALAVATRSLDGDPQAANGTVTIYALRQPAAPARAPLDRERFWWGFLAAEPAADPTNPDSWDLGAAILRQTFATDAAGTAQLALLLPAGIYRAALETQDRFGRKVTARLTVQVVDPQGRHYPVKIPSHFSAPKWSAEPGETFTALWGTGYDRGRAFVEIECDGKLLQSYWTAANRTQELIEQPVTSAMRGGFTVRVTTVRENRAYLNQQIVTVPWTDRQLTVRWEHFRSKLTPGQKETWTAVVTGPNAKRAPAEMVAALYDASLDQYQALHWPETFGVFRQELFRGGREFQNTKANFNFFRGWQPPDYREVNWSYRTFPLEIVRGGSAGAGANGALNLEAFSVMAPEAGFRGAVMDRGSFSPNTTAGTRLNEAIGDFPSSVTIVDKQSMGPAAPKPDLGKIALRQNLNETAFFLPQLTAGDDGVVKMVFTMPEALTEWRFLGFAHDQDLRSGFLTATVVTAKDLMVEPNPPRFVREGDQIEFTVQVSNQTDQPQTGTVRLTFADAATQQARDSALGNRAPDQTFAVPAKQSRTFSWRVAVPDGLGYLTYKAVAASARFSDGEEGFLPVLSRRILVTESLPLPIRGATTKPFEFPKLLNSGSSATLRNESLTVQMVSQPAWYAVMALPYLMDYPYECSEQVFNRYYANALARHIAGSDPKIRRIFDLWKNTPALDSPLEKNQDVKSVMIEETPWLLEAKAESQSRRDVGLLFDANRLGDESARAARTLSERQLGEGLWPWFPGGPPSEYISLYIATGFGRLRHLGIDADLQPALKSLAALDAGMDDHYRRILESANPDGYVPDSTDALYLYGRSFFLSDQPIAAAHQAAVDFYLRQSRRYWVKVLSLQSQAHLALALQRFGDETTPTAIMKSLKERSVTDEELGMFWPGLEGSPWWYDAPIETQALMIEAFAEVSHDAPAVEDCKVWLLKQKQTQDWKTTTATADAIYGLLLQGDPLLSRTALVEVALAGVPIKPERVEAGTGFYEQKFTRGEITPAMGRITVKKTDSGVSWGSVSWQYLEDIAKITPHEATPLKLTKTLWIKETTAQGQVLKRVTGPVSVGDELVVRLELRSDRDLEFVHLKDERGSGTEPVNGLSQYRFQDGLGYYETTRDTANHFFIDYLPKGTYVFEYSSRVQLRGRYQTGIAEIQCMYAPEFGSHSESLVLEVK